MSGMRRSYQTSNALQFSTIGNSPLTRIYKDVGLTGNSWTVFLQATFGPTTGEAISLRNKSYLVFAEDNGAALFLAVVWATVSGLLGQTKPNWSAVMIIWIIIVAILSW